MLKHDKPHRCDFPNCSRRDKGFSTVNDLDRHKKSVHRLKGSKGANKKSYRCASLQCRSPEKIWPRLDNFKQHCSRMHPDEDQDLLIKE